ncbi:MAG: DUF2321 domain-containing protein [Syntrophobacteraceae bacterium]
MVGFYSESKKAGYDTAQICKNGHVITRGFHDMPEFRKNFCDQCGAETVTACAHCRAEIRGFLRGGMPSVHQPPAPQYCVECGKAYPWTERKLEAFQQYSNELDELNSQEKEELQETIHDLIRATPKTPLAEKKFKRIMAKVGKESFQAVKGILTDIVSETVKKTLFGE